MIRSLPVVVLTCTALAIQGKQCCKVQVESDGLSDRVLGGHLTQKRNWPWLVEVFVFTGTARMHCSGTLVSDRHVLTAGHCVANLEPKYEKRRWGSTWIGVSSHNGSDWEPGLDKEVDFDIHPKFVYPSDSFPPYDVAIVKLRRPITFSDYDLPICVANSFRENIGETGYIVGYGFNSVYRTDPGRPTWNVTFNEADGMLHENLIEFRTIERCSSVTGDSGGPLMSNRKGVWYHVGTASIAQTKWFSMHSRLSRACDWIEKVTSGYVKCAAIDG